MNNSKVAQLLNISYPILQGGMAWISDASLAVGVSEAGGLGIITGVGDGRGVAASFMLGADGVQMGTRFLVSKECTVHQNYKDRVIKAKDIDTEVTGTSTSHPIRVLRNKLTREYLKLEKEKGYCEELKILGRGALRKAVKDGDVENGSVMAGQIAGLVKLEKSCEEIILEIVRECENNLRRFYE